MEVVSILVGGVVGFLASVGSNLLLEGKKQKEKEKLVNRNRLEELFILLNKYNKNILKPPELQEDIEQERLTMLVRFYFPQFKKEFDEYIIECSNITQLKLDKQNYIQVALVDLPKKLHPLNQLIVDEGKNFEL